jgi:hypothetical protein
MLPMALNLSCVLYHVAAPNGANSTHTRKKCEDGKVVIVIRLGQFGLCVPHLVEISYHFYYRKMLYMLT